MKTILRLVVKNRKKFIKLCAFICTFIVLLTVDHIFGEIAAQAMGFTAGIFHIVGFTDEIRE